MKKTATTKLIDVFRAHGIRELSRQSDVPLHTIYRVGNIQHERLPIHQLGILSGALRIDLDELVERWTEEKVLLEQKTKTKTKRGA